MTPAITWQKALNSHSCPRAEVQQLKMQLPFRNSRCNYSFPRQIQNDWLLHGSTAY